MVRKSSEWIAVPGTTSKSTGKRLSCWEVSESVEEERRRGEGENAS